MGLLRSVSSSSENRDVHPNTLSNTGSRNMTAALEFVCKKIPPERDAHDLRKRIGDAMIASAQNGRRTFVDFQEAGLRALDESLRAQKRNWLTRLFAKA